ncbi:hypothetical protein FVA81_25230 [Rhizobium sp. WL3]|uniref:hypothetical protein n=1 Tax=Rhizobium sp. WL3 TaxID=2603277 RepID=UPI0011C1F9A4|nr:hypothetical protein [Rhizobium sp. WL3]QEE47705.1 hypothetical protein FVA81_25230 [Rhizobium sp. WL3]
MMDLQCVPAGSLAGRWVHLDLPKAVEALIEPAGRDARSNLRVAEDSGDLRITGDAACMDAFETIVALAEVYSGRRVVAELTIRPHLRVRSSSAGTGALITDFERKLS